MPPLKDIPDEIYPDSGNDSDPSLRIELLNKVRSIRIELGDKRFAHFEKAFLKLGIHNPKKAAKLALSNLKLPIEDRENPNISEVFITEKSLKNGFESVFGAKCDVLASIIYMKASKNHDYCRINVSDFYEVVSPFIVSIQVLKF